MPDVPFTDVPEDDSERILASQEADPVERAVAGIASMDDQGPAADNTRAVADEPTADPGDDVPADAEMPGEGADGRDERPFARAGEAARGAQQSLRDGIAAFKSVREASQLHASARDELRQMREQMEADAEVLQHRIDIEQRYPQIVSEQSAELEEASTLSGEAVRRADGLDLEIEGLEQQLATMKLDNEEQLRPYRNLAESTKGRADDKARTLADAKRAAKSAETALADATKRREQRIATANRAVDNAQERMRRSQAELDALQQDEKASPATIARLQNEVVSEKAHIDAAREEVFSVTEEARKAVEAAQQRLFDQKSQLEAAEREAEAAKKEATERRSEYDALLKDAQDREKALSEQIKERRTAADQARREHEDAEARIAAAQALLEEAEAIHTTPQETIALRDRIARQQTDVDVQQDEVDELAANEQQLRKGTFRQRLVLVLALVAVVVLVVALIVAIVTHH